MEIVLIDQSSKCVILTPFSSLTEEYVWLGDPYGKSFKVTDLCEQQYLRFQGMDASLLHSELWPLVSGNHSAVHGIQEVRNWTDLKKKKNKTTSSSPGTLEDRQKQKRAILISINKTEWNKITKARLQ